MLMAREPLAADPLAVEGAIALRGTKYGRAEQLLVAARQRDPRNRPVRFLLADTFLRQQKIDSALQELVVLTYLSPQMAQPVTAMLAQYSRTPGATPRLRRALASNAPIENALLLQLAADPANAQLILSIASRIRGSELLAWQQTLLSSSVKAGQVSLAWELWRRFSNLPTSAVGDFSDSKLPSPFTWTLIQSGEGVASTGGRGLDVDFFGRRNVSLASKLLMLRSGLYELRFRVNEPSSDPSSLHWVFTCITGGRELVNLPLSKTPSGWVSASFQVPLGCDAQRMELKGLAQIYPAEVSLSIADLQIRKLP